MPSYNLGFTDIYTSRGINKPSVSYTFPDTEINGNVPSTNSEDGKKTDTAKKSVFPWIILLIAGALAVSNKG